MDTTPLTQKAVYSTDVITQSALQQPPVGSEKTQTVQAVQALGEATAGTNKTAVAQQSEPLDAEHLAKMVEQMDAFVGTFNRGLKFRVDEDSGQHVVTVVDSKSGDIIRQIPTEELLDVVARLAEASGGLIDVKA